LNVHAAAQSYQSLWRRCIEAVIEGRQRKADAELAKYLRSHKHSLSNELRVELERRCMANERQA
jgi:hypothetical protein